MSYHETGLLADPEFRTKRAKKAAAARTSIDYFVRTLVERAPELTSEQRAKLTDALRAGGGAK